ncbi:BMC domain-containing protein [Paenibacillus sp. MER TA 81-3]|uniref:BMC domain-containing protein n=1 Tax=Paenibacillus sp. MER TA 81-3 TaxID=2939573 RepID=UPI00203FEBDE|nr:BMC domain-containing protein [Paenibacillus sp. MER TA 81-3]MCM3337795.1 BMC domain-containing protein [Paenibacillus sp. MER TA 81-3]
MRHSALGLVEVRGYLGAVAVADAALKAASVTCIGVEIIKGGLVTVKLDGDVGAVQAAVEAGAEMATQLDVLVTRHVIARMHEETAALVASPVDTDGSQGQLEECAARSQEQQDVTAKVSEKASVKVSIEDKEERTVGIEVAAASAVTESAASGSISNAEVKKAAEATTTEPLRAKESYAAESKEPAAAVDSQSDKMELAAAAATKEVDEVKPASGQTGTVPAAVKAAATAEKTTSVQKNQGNGDNSRVKPVPAPAAKRSKKTKKASS